MNILIIADDYLPKSKKISAKMLHELACYFKSKGNYVTCIVPNNYRDIPYEILDGVVIYRFNSGKIKNTNKLKRLLNESRFSNKVCKVIRSNPTIEADLVIYYSPSIFFGKAIRKIKQYFKIPSYLILRDFFPQWAIDHGMIRKKSLIATFFRYYEKINYQAADQIGVMSPANLKWFNSYTNNLYVDRAYVLYNWVDKTFLNFIKSNRNFRTQYNLENKIIFIYGGNIGYAQNIMSIIILADSLRNNSRAFFLLIGQGDEYNLMKRKIEELKLTNMLLLPAMPQEEYYSVQKIADIGLFCLNAEHKTHNFPGKILGYIAQGMPILGCVNKGNDLMEIINKHNAGYISASGDSKALLENAIKLIDSLKNRENCARYAELLLDKYFDVSSAYNMIISKVKKE